MLIFILKSRYVKYLEEIENRKKEYDEQLKKEKEEREMGIHAIRMKQKKNVELQAHFDEIQAIK